MSNRTSGAYSIIVDENFDTINGILGYITEIANEGRDALRPIAFTGTSTDFFANDFNLSYLDNNVPELILPEQVSNDINFTDMLALIESLEDILPLPPDLTAIDTTGTPLADIDTTFPDLTEITIPDFLVDAPVLDFGTAPALTEFEAPPLPDVITPATPDTPTFTYPDVPVFDPIVIPEAMLIEIP